MPTLPPQNGWTVKGGCYQRIENGATMAVYYTNGLFRAFVNKRWSEAQYQSFSEAENDAFSMIG